MRRGKTEREKEMQIRGSRRGQVKIRKNKLHVLRFNESK